MRGPLRPILSLLIVWGISGCYSKPSKLAVPQVVMCVQQARWPDLLNEMKIFGQQRSLKFFGGVEVTSLPEDKNVSQFKNVPQFNAYLAQGYNYYLGGDLDLWITSDLFKLGAMYFSASVKSSATPEQANLARGLLARIAPLGSPLGSGATNQSARSGGHFNTRSLCPLSICGRPLQRKRILRGG